MKVKNRLNRPFFSIITSTHNSEKFINSNLNSVIEQTYKDYEHIFIDGDSTDETLSKLKTYKKKSSASVKIFKFPAKGISNAFNKGISKASGRYLIHLNSDDSFHNRQVLKKAQNFLIAENLPDWIYGKAQIIESDGKKIGIFPDRWILQIAWGYLMMFFPFVPHQSVFIQKKVFEKFGMFDERLRTKMDHDMWFRIRKKTKWFFFNEIVCNFMVRPDAESSGLKNKKAGVRDFEQVQRRYMNKFEFYLARIINKVVYSVNNTHR